MLIINSRPDTFSQGLAVCWRPAVNCDNCQVKTEPVKAAASDRQPVNVLQLSNHEYSDVTKSTHRIQTGRRRAH